LFIVQKEVCHNIHALEALIEASRE
jgi:hypothetical protein